MEQLFSKMILQIVLNSAIISSKQFRTEQTERKEINMVIDTSKLDLALAKRCRTMSALRAGVSPQTLRKIRQGGDVRPDVVGRVAQLLKVDVSDIVSEVQL